MALRKAQRLVLPRSQPRGWECILIGSASGQATGGGSPPRIGSQPPGWGAMAYPPAAGLTLSLRRSRSVSKSWASHRWFLEFFVKAVKWVQPHP
ncbi:hypothetical protein [Nostoc sp.]|uniref:hypothetical protein n=1 Tax=Nostoc sp. TaxID=1180 RepID=UPI002FF6DAA9